MLGISRKESHILIAQEFYKEKNKNLKIKSFDFKITCFAVDNKGKKIILSLENNQIFIFDIELKKNQFIILEKFSLAFNCKSPVIAMSVSKKYHIFGGKNKIGVFNLKTKKIQNTVSESNLINLQSIYFFENSLQNDNTEQSSSEKLSFFAIAGIFQKRIKKVKICRAIPPIFGDE